MSIVDNIIHLSTYTNIKEYVEDKLKFVYYDGDDISFAFNSQYVIDILHVIVSDFLLITIFDSNSSVMFESFDFFTDTQKLDSLKIKNYKNNNDNIYVLMPIRL